MGTTFFKEIAGHNLERFHSECVAWVLNRMPKENKIFKKFNVGESFHFVKAVAEVQQHDIVLLYKNSEDKYKYVFVENKTKSSLSRIKKGEKYLKSNKKSDTHKKRIIQKDGMLQTAYYQLRWWHKKSDLTYCKGLLNAFDFSAKWSENKGKNQLERITLEFKKIEAPEWVILSQMDVNSFKGIYDDEYNLKATCKILDVENNYESEWSYLTYKDLFEDIKLSPGKSNENVDIVLINEYARHAQNIPSENETLAEFIELKQKILDENIEGIEIQISIGSANGNDAMIQLYKVIKFPSEIYNLGIEKIEEGSFMTIGIQIEGDTFKYKISAEDYKDVIIINKKEHADENSQYYKYNSECEKYLENIIDDVDSVKFNKTRRKSHCSFTYKNKDSSKPYKENIISFLKKI